MIMKKTVLLILIDGFRYDYVNPDDSPFLHSLAKLNIDGAVRETFAFELRPAFFAGLHPDECGVGNMYFYNSVDSPFRNINISSGDRTIISDKLRKEAGRRGYTLVKHHGGCAEIPLNLLKYFDFSEKIKTSDEGALGKHKTLFDLLRMNDKKWLWIGYPGSPGTAPEILGELDSKLQGDEDFIYLHFSELDWAGHEGGPHSDVQKKTLKKIDLAVSDVFKTINSRFSDVKSLIFGDHGQVEVRKHIDIEKMLAETGLVLTKDYLYFLDSTQARFWFFNDNARNTITSLLLKISDGKILSASHIDELHFNFPDKRFGELIFVVNEGIGIFPNFFQHTNPCKGLHGYLPEVKANWAKFIIGGLGIRKNIDDVIEMPDIFPTLLGLLDIEKPRESKTKPIVSDFIPEGGKDKYKITLIMPTYNRLEILKESLAKIEEQTFPKEDFELLVVDDGSSDGTKEFLGNYSKKTPVNFTFFTNNHNGPASARNRALENARGKIILSVGDDMIMYDSDFIEKHARFHVEYPAAGDACLGMVEWDKDIEITPLMEYITKEGAQQFGYEGLTRRDIDHLGYEYFWSSNISFKRIMTASYGLFNNEIFKHAMWEDIELGHRLAKAGLVIHFRKDFTLYHKHSITFREFAERQRMVGWYNSEVKRLGVDLAHSYSELDKEKIFSRQAYDEIIEAIEEYESSKESIDAKKLKIIYRCALNYALMVGYMEREEKKSEEKVAVVSLLHNLSKTEIRLAEVEQELHKVKTKSEEQEKQLKAIYNSKRWKLTAPLGWLIKKLHKRNIIE